jgi:ethanolamine utilization protein EutQ
VKKLISDDVVKAEAAAGRTRIHAPRSGSIITPAAYSKAHELGVTFDFSEKAPAPVSADEGSATRVVDRSGVVVVRGHSVRLGKFAGAGPDKNVGLTDVITGRDGSPMTAGIMSFGREDSFAWKLDYDEVDLVLEGTLAITIDGRVLEGRAGDVLYIPKGSSIIFGTPGRTRVFYVTYPADWAQAANAPARPQK